MRAKVRLRAFLSCCCLIAAPGASWEDIPWGWGGLQVQVDAEETQSHSGRQSFNALQHFNTLAAHFANQMSFNKLDQKRKRLSVIWTGWNFQITLTYKFDWIGNHFATALVSCSVEFFVDIFISLWALGFLILKSVITTAGNRLQGNSNPWKKAYYSRSSRGIIITNLYSPEHREQFNLACLSISSLLLAARGRSRIFSRGGVFQKKQKLIFRARVEAE